MLDQRRSDTLQQSDMGLSHTSCCAAISSPLDGLMGVSRKAIFFSFSIGERFSRFPLPSFVVFSYWRY